MADDRPLSGSSRNDLRKGGACDEVDQQEPTSRILALERELQQIYDSPAWRSAQRIQRLQLVVHLWRHRIFHPIASLRALISRALPFRLRARILRTIGRGRPQSTPTIRTRESFFRSTTQTAGNGTGSRPFIIFLPAVDWFLRVQRPHHLLSRLGERGWPVFHAQMRLEVGSQDIGLVDEAVNPGVRIFTVPSSRSENVAVDPLQPDDLKSMEKGFARFREREQIRHAIVLCQSPVWYPLVRVLREVFGWKVVYDRMDLHEGFSTMNAAAAKQERELLEMADLVTVTSDVLERSAGCYAHRIIRLPNACDPNHWTKVEGPSEFDGLEGPVIGYFGAISEWFDTQLVADLAIARPAWNIVLIGSTYGADTTRLERLPNVHLLGERPYDELPGLASSFDVGIIPFSRTPLTDATDPVKFYEMMALGLEVVATPLPELVPHSGLCRLADGSDEFLQSIEGALRTAANRESIARRREFARHNSWDVRTDTLETALRGLFPLVSIAIVSFNNRELTEICLKSVEQYTCHPNLEIIIIDNASSDGSREWLSKEAAALPHVSVILNESNSGFPAACNQAAAAASGEVLCLLNNDTIVTPGWLTAMLDELESSPLVGMVGPSSNGVANEAKVTAGYEDLAGLHDWAGDFARTHDGESFSIPMLALFCVVIRRKLWDELGGLDERFEVGMFEDDDLSRRIRNAGYDLRCRRDAWVHHFQEASFGALPAQEYERIFEANRRRFRDKWAHGSGGKTSA